MEVTLSSSSSDLCNEISDKKVQQIEDWQIYWNTCTQKYTETCLLVSSNMNLDNNHQGKQKTNNKIKFNKTTLFASTVRIFEPSSLIGIIAASSHKACKSLPEYPKTVAI